MTHAVNDGDTLLVGAALTVRCLHTPCHTTGHMCYVLSGGGGGGGSGGGGGGGGGGGPAAAFTGDMLFVGGCGRIFEGDPNPNPSPNRLTT